MGECSKSNMPSRSFAYSSRLFWRQDQGRLLSLRTDADALSSPQIQQVFPMKLDWGHRTPREPRARTPPTSGPRSRLRVTYVMSAIDTRTARGGESLIRRVG